MGPGSHSLDLIFDYIGAMTTIVPMFPLPNFFLFPNSLEPLHVFEERYRQMVDDQLDGRGHLVMGTILEAVAGESPSVPPVFEIAGLGEIAQHRRLPDGRYVMMLLGLSRVSIQEVASDRLYRQVEISVLEEVEASDIDELRLRGPLREAIGVRGGADYQLPDELDVSRLSDILAQLLPLPQSNKQQLFAQLDVAVRAEQTLAEHAAWE